MRSTPASPGSAQLSLRRTARLENVQSDEQLAHAALPLECLDARLAQGSGLGCGRAGRS